MPTDQELYGADAAEWLWRWDSGDPVWSIEMGGLGPSYEQCIQITAAEVLRWLLENKSDHTEWSDSDKWAATREALEKATLANPVIDSLGLSGAQWGAAVNLATNLYRDGPCTIMNDDRMKDRHIQVSKGFPVVAA